MNVIVLWVGLWGVGRWAYRDVCSGGGRGLLIVSFMFNLSQRRVTNFIKDMRPDDEELKLESSLPLELGVFAKVLFGSKSDMQC